MHVWSKSFPTIDVFVVYTAEEPTRPGLTSLVLTAQHDVHVAAHTRCTCCCTYKTRQEIEPCRAVDYIYELKHVPQGVKGIGTHHTCVDTCVMWLLDA